MLIIRVPLLPLTALRLLHISFKVPLYSFSSFVLFEVSLVPVLSVFALEITVSIVIVDSNGDSSGAGVVAVFSSKLLEYCKIKCM